MADSEWVRVKDKDTKHEFTVHRMSLDSTPEAYDVLKNKDAVDASGTPLPAKPHLTPTQAKDLKNEETS